MKFNFLILSFYIVATLSACGQKGALFQPETSVTKENKTLFVNTHDVTIEPEPISIGTFIISGYKKQVEENNTKGWQSLFTSLKNTNNLVRYIAFGIYPINTSANTALDIVVGTPQKKNINGQTRKTIKGGQYLRFKANKRGINQITSLINQAHSYLNNHPNIKHGDAGDFIIEKKQYIELYISVKKAHS